MSFNLYEYGTEEEELCYLLLPLNLGEYSLNALCTNLTKNDLKKHYKKPIDINTEPVTNRPIRSAAKKAKLTLKTCF